MGPDHTGRFHKSNVDFQPLTNESNSEAVVNALDQIAHSHPILVKENKELRNVVEVLSATVESDQLQYQNTLSSLVDTTNKLHDTTNKLHAEFKRYTRLYNIPRSAIRCVPLVSNLLH